MRPRILRSLCALMLLPTAALAQNVSVVLTPISYPIQIPGLGGTFDYLLFLTNQDSLPLSAEVWCDAILPGGGSWGPLLGPFPGTLSPGQTLGYYRVQSVPSSAHYGMYTFRAYMGNYPNTIWASDSFQFEKFLMGGTELWVARANGPYNGEDEADDIAVDNDGNVYVTGGLSGSENQAVTTIKYNSVGEQQWMAQYDGLGNFDDWGRSIALDNEGNVYVAGSSYAGNPTPIFNIVVFKYNQFGVQQWMAVYDGPVHRDDYATGVVLDADGYVYVTGCSDGSGYTYDYVTLKYNNSGIQQWVARYNGPGNGYDASYNIALDGGGNVYVAGYSTGLGTGRDYVTVKYNNDGIQQWVARYSGPGNYDDLASGLALDFEGNVYVTGTSYEIGPNANFTTLKYNSSGAQQWVAMYDVQDADFASDITVGQNGGVYITGQSYASGTGYDYATVKYNTDGIQQWAARYSGPGNAIDYANSIALDSDDNVYVTGLSTGSGSGYDYATIKYSPSGQQLWAARYNGPGNGVDMAAALALDNHGSVFVTGRSMGSGTNFDYATIKYSSGTLGAWESRSTDDIRIPLPQESSLDRIRPNPFNASTALSYQLSARSYVSLKVYDTAGRLVATLVDGWRQAGRHEVRFDGSKLATGIYLLNMKTGNYCSVQKMVLLK